MSMTRTPPEARQNGAPSDAVRDATRIPIGDESRDKSARPIRVLVADDHEFVRRGLRALLAAKPEEFEICGEASCGREGVKKAKQLQPDVVVLDVSMPGLNGLETTRLILREVPRAEVLILTMHESEQLMEEVLTAGARGYLLKSDASRDLLLAIESLHRRRPFFTTKIAQKVLEGFLKDSARGRCKSPLTPAERRVVQLLAEGKSNKEVANLQDITVKTAETHRANIMRKLGLRSVCELVHYAVRNEIIVA